jgi:hypothetical protein
MSIKKIKSVRELQRLSEGVSAKGQEPGQSGVAMQVLLHRVGHLSQGKIQAMKVYERPPDTELILDKIVPTVKQMSRADLTPTQALHILKSSQVTRVDEGGGLPVADEVRLHLYLHQTLRQRDLQLDHKLILVRDHAYLTCSLNIHWSLRKAVVLQHLHQNQYQNVR